MHNIRKICIRILLVLAVVFVYEKGIEFAYRPYTETVIYTMQDREKVEGTIETLMCGTSTTQRGFDPEIVNTEMETVSFNMGTSLQPIKGTYHLIQSVVNKNPVETVFLGVAPDFMRREDEPTGSKVPVYDRLTNLKEKAYYLWDGCSIEEWLYLSLYSARVEDYFDMEFLKGNLKYKMSESYRNGVRRNKIYRGDGMYSLNRKYKGEKITSLTPGKPKFSADLVNKESEAYLRKTIEYCKKNNIELVLVYLPISGKAVEKAGDISTVHEYYDNLAKEYGITFFDFNYYKDLIPMFGNDQFESDKHLNAEGAATFTKLLTEVYQAYHSGEDMKNYFLDTCPYYSPVLEE